MSGQRLVALPMTDDEASLEPTSITPHDTPDEDPDGDDAA